MDGWMEPQGSHSVIRPAIYLFWCKGISSSDLVRLAHWKDFKKAEHAPHTVTYHSTRCVSSSWVLLRGVCHRYLDIAMYLL